MLEVRSMLWKQAVDPKLQVASEQEQKAVAERFREGVEAFKGALSDVGKTGGLLIPETATIITNFRIPSQEDPIGLKGSTLLAKFTQALKNQPQEVQDRYAPVIEAIRDAASYTCYYIPPNYTDDIKWAGRSRN